MKLTFSKSQLWKITQVLTIGVNNKSRVDAQDDFGKMNFENGGLLKYWCVDAQDDFGKMNFENGGLKYSFFSKENSIFLL